MIHQLCEGSISFPFCGWAALDFYGALRSRTYDRSISKVFFFDKSLKVFEIPNQWQKKKN